MNTKNLITEPVHDMEYDNSEPFYHIKKMRRVADATGSVVMSQIGSARITAEPGRTPVVS